MINLKYLSKKSRIILIVSLVMAACFVLAAGVYLFIGSKILSRAYEPDLIIFSPDGHYELVVREWGYTVGTGAEIYIRKPGQDKWYNSWLEKKIGTTSTDDGYYTFAGGNYHVEWGSAQVTIYYYKGLDIENRNDRSTWRGIVSYEFA